MTTMDRIRLYEEQMIADRRWLHEHPELSGQESQTIDYIVKALEELGLSIHIIPNGGVIGVLNEKAAAPCVLLRADVDALPVMESEENLAECRRCISKNPGVMHACGHDAHTAMMLAAARALTAMKEDVPGCVLFVFERGEEKGGRGFLENLLPYIEEKFDVGACYAAHVRWDIPTGKIAVMDGAVMAGAFGFDVKIHGKGGHGHRYRQNRRGPARQLRRHPLRQAEVQRQRRRRRHGSVRLSNQRRQVRRVGSPHHP